MAALPYVENHSYAQCKEHHLILAEKPSQINRTTDVRRQLLLAISELYTTSLWKLKPFLE